MYSIAVDIGNSNIVTGIFKNHQCIYDWRTETHQENLETIYSTIFLTTLKQKAIDNSDIKAVYISSVVPLVLIKFLKALTSYQSKIFIINKNAYKTLPLYIRHPEQIGTDLVCNAMAAYNQIKSGFCVIDFGTALTCTTVDKNRKIVGVSISPGIKTAINALSNNTAQLPVVELLLPDSVLGKNTKHAIQAGILLGYVGLVRYLIENIKKELAQNIKIIATGGLVNVLTPLHVDFDYIDPLLTLKGAYLVGIKNWQN